MSEIKDNSKPIDEDFQSTYKQKFLVNLIQELGSDLGHKKLCRSVSKAEKLHNKVNKIIIQSFNKRGQQIVDKIHNELKTNETICENDLINDKTMTKTIEDIIEKQTKVEKINESIVEKTFDLNEIKSEESRLQPIKQLLSNENHIKIEESVKTIISFTKIKRKNT